MWRAVNDRFHDRHQGDFRVTAKKKCILRNTIFPSSSVTHTARQANKVNGKKNGVAGLGGH